MSGSDHQQALDYWNSLAGDGGLPSIKDLDPARLDSFRNTSFLIALAGKAQMQLISFVGKEVYSGADGVAVAAGAPVSGAAADSLLGLLAGEFEQVIQSGGSCLFDYSANIGAGHLGAGVLLPFGSQDQVQFIWGVLGDAAAGADEPAPAESVATESVAAGGFDAGADEESGGFDAAPEVAESAPAPAPSAEQTPAPAPSQAPPPPPPPPVETLSSLGTSEDDIDGFDGGEVGQEMEHSSFDSYQDTWEGEAYEIAAVVTDEASTVDFGEDSGATATGFDDWADACDGPAQNMSDVVTEEYANVTTVSGPVQGEPKAEQGQDAPEPEEPEDMPADPVEALFEDEAGTDSDASNAEAAGMDSMADISGAGDMEDSYSAFDAPSEMPEGFDDGKDEEPFAAAGDVDPQKILENALEEALSGGDDDGDEGFATDQVAAEEASPEIEPRSDLEQPAPVMPSPTPDEGQGAFFDILADGRTAADEIVHVDSRSRDSLYKVLAKAFLLFNEAQADHDTYKSILKATGIREQARAPFTPVLKLVFGKDYDKTRITEYAAALSHARREGQTSESIADYIAEFPGGIKGLVKAERIAKKREKGIAADEALESAKSRLQKRKSVGTVVAKHKVEEGEFALLLARAGKNPNELQVIKVLDERQEILDAALKRAVKSPKL